MDRTKGIVLIVTAIVVVSAGAALALKPWQRFGGSPRKIEATQPIFDLRFAKTVEVEPAIGAIIETANDRNVFISLEIPPGALTEKQTISLAPFQTVADAQTPTQGVAVGPPNLTFKQPVTLTFNFGLSEQKNDPAQAVRVGDAPVTAKSQVLRYASADNSLSSVLVARALETTVTLPARITRGGSYLFSLDGKYQTDFARATLAADTSSSISKIEAASSLIFRQKRLSSTERNVAQTAVKVILDKQNPPLPELYAAVILNQKIIAQNIGFVRSAIAQDQLWRNYLEFLCKEDGTPLEFVFGAATLAEYLGYTDIAKGCKDEGRNRVNARARAVLEDENASFGDLLQALQHIQLSGSDEGQELETAEVFRLRLLDALAKKIEVLGSGTATIPEREQARNLDPSSGPPTEGALEQVAQGAVGLAFLQAFGLPSFTDAGIQAFVSHWGGQIRGALPIFTDFCQDFVAEGGFPRTATIETAVAEIEVHIPESPELQKAERETLALCKEKFLSGELLRDLEKAERDAQNINIDETLAEPFEQPQGLFTDDELDDIRQEVPSPDDSTGDNEEPVLPDQEE